MNTAIRFQILEVAVYISQIANDPRKAMHSTIFPPARGKH